MHHRYDPARVYDLRLYTPKEQPASRAQIVVKRHYRTDPTVTLAPRSVIDALGVVEQIERKLVGPRKCNQN